MKASAEKRHAGVCAVRSLGESLLGTNSLARFHCKSKRLSAAIRLPSAISELPRLKSASKSLFGEYLFNFSVTFKLILTVVFFFNPFLLLLAAVRSFSPRIYNFCAYKPACFHLVSNKNLLTTF